MPDSVGTAARRRGRTRIWQRATSFRRDKCALALLCLGLSCATETTDGVPPTEQPSGGGKSGSGGSGSAMAGVAGTSQAGTGGVKGTAGSTSTGGAGGGGKGSGGKSSGGSAGAGGSAGGIGGGGSGGKGGTTATGGVGGAGKCAACTAPASCLCCGAQCFCTINCGSDDDCSNAAGDTIDASYDHCSGDICAADGACN
jgi:hypothetical protein